MRVILPRLTTAAQAAARDHAAIAGGIDSFALMQQAAATDADHNASLGAFYLTFGDVMSTEMVGACLRRNLKRGLAAAE